MANVTVEPRCPECNCGRIVLGKLGQAGATVDRGFAWCFMCRVDRPIDDFLHSCDNDRGGR